MNTTGCSSKYKCRVQVKCNAANKHATKNPETKRETEQGLIKLEDGNSSPM